MTNLYWAANLYQAASCRYPERAVQKFIYQYNQAKKLVYLQEPCDVTMSLPRSSPSISF